VFPEKEKMMYMSGRALHPVSVNLAAQLQEEFGGELDISFSAGADCFNVADLIAAGLKPVTVSSDLLKPGGYGRLSQYTEELAAATQGCSSIEAFITARAGIKDVRKAALENLVRYAARVSGEKSYRKSHYPERSVKTERPLTPFDCVKAPCVTTCPASQEVPEYMFHTANGEYDKALEVILRTNPLPTITGMVCDHLCMSKCTRINYDDPLRIRDIKRFVVEQTTGVKEPRPLPANGQQVAVIGAGPAGLSCAWFAALAGFAVDVYEAKPFAGGMAADAIPAFRLSDEQIRQDIARVERLGVRFHFNEKIDADRFAALRGQARYVFVGLGAQTNKGMDIPGETLPRVYGALALLSSVRRGQPLPVGKRVAVVGGGNSAMDAARTAWRLGAAVTLLYRRTMHEMPADREELEAIIDEGVTIREIVGPAAITEQDGALAVRCDLMRLGEPDESGRRRPEKSGEEETLLFDSVVMAIGQAVRPDIGAWQTFQADPVTCETRMDGVYAGGDLVHGALNLITGIADGRRAAEDMMRRSGIDSREALGHANKGLSEGQLQFRSARRKGAIFPAETPLAARRGFNQVIGSLGSEEARNEAARCLYCSDVCNVCVTVCPNRANFSYRTAPVACKVSVLHREGDAVRQDVTGWLRITQRVQVCNIADFCNECGNCRTFCPTAGAPYQDKPRVCLSEEAFREEDPAYLFCLLDGKPALKYRLGEQVLTMQ
jgi:putative selenate reductase